MKNLKNFNPKNWTLVYSYSRNSAAHFTGNIDLQIYARNKKGNLQIMKSLNSYHSKITSNGTSYSRRRVNSVMTLFEFCMFYVNRDQHQREYADFEDLTQMEGFSATGERWIRSVYDDDDGWSGIYEQVTFTVSGSDIIEI